MNLYKIFVSSTIDDLEEERAAVDQEIEATEIFAPIQVERLPASDETSRSVCLREVGEADAIVLILKDRYGFVPKSSIENLSVTHLEYREAKRLNKPVFAFILDGIQPEPKLASFIQEVSDFDEGVLRKKWTNAQDLRIEVRRALLCWVARLARQGKSEDAKQVATQLERQFTFGRLPMMIIPSGSTLYSANQVWNDTLLGQLSWDCKQRLLPTPDLIDGSIQDNNVAGLKICVLPAVQAGRIEIRVEIIDQHHVQPILTPVELDAALTDEGARFVAQCTLALVLLIADDWSAAIDQIIIASKHRNASNSSKIQLLATAAFVSASNQGQRCVEIVEHILGLPKFDSHAVSASVMAITAASLRLKHAGARHAILAIDKLAVQILIAALKQDPSAAENIYNLARHFLGKEGAVALSFYWELLRVNPSYEERWYFHRDIALIYYDQGDYEKAGEYYDRSCHLKSIDSELFRFAGDSYYYDGYWTDALLRYERALAIEPVEKYFLDGKIAFCRNQLRNGMSRSKAFQRRRNISHWFSRLGARLAEAEWHRLAKPIFQIASSICELNFDADNWLSLYANRKGDYENAVSHLKLALSAIPEDPSTNLNLAMNLIFQNDGQLDDCARKYASSAIFHGGPETLNRFRLQLTNTENKDALIEQFQEFFEMIRLERNEWVKRRREVLKPEWFNGILHVEVRQ